MFLLSLTTYAWLCLQRSRNLGITISRALYACRERAVKILVIAFNWVVRRPAVAIGSFGPGGRPVNKIGVGLANVLGFFALVVCCQMKVPDAYFLHHIFSKVMTTFGCCGQAAFDQQKVPSMP